ncbi:G-protein coupled receptor 4-like isoform X2 [Channa argus]|uniref:G-protein coupled receptor 4-like isoform X2 n=1 Tax=Channa argus TaxID=215402 RepID=UPI00351FD3C2
MDDFYIINTSDYNSYNNYNHSDITYDYGKAGLIMYVVKWIFISVGLPLNVAAIYKTSFLVQKDQVAPVYFINLLVSNLIQLCSLIILLTVTDFRIYEVFNKICGFGAMASIDFMVCIALERYLVITSPQFSCLRQVIQIPIVVCFVIWAPPLFCAFRVTFFVEFVSTEIIISFVCFILLPFPLLMYLLGGALKALSAAGSVPPDEKRRTVAILVLVLLIYTLLFLPTIIWSLVRGIGLNTVSFVLITIIRLIPLTNMSVYFFLRKGAADKLLACVCCCSMDHGEISSRVNNDTVITVSSV